MEQGSQGDLRLWKGIRAPETLLLGPGTEQGTAQNVTFEWLQSSCSCGTWHSLWQQAGFWSLVCGSGQFILGVGCVDNFSGKTYLTEYFCVITMAVK